MKVNRREYKVGDTYTVIEDGVRLRGTITRIDDAGYYVEWSDGTKTLETRPDPALS